MKRLSTLCMLLLLYSIALAQVEEDFTPNPAGWVLSSGASYTIVSGNDVITTPGVGGNNPAVIGTPAVSKTSNTIKVCLDINAYTANLNTQIPFPCATFMDVLFVNAAVTSANDAQMPANIYARVDNHQLPTNGGSTCFTFTFPAGVTATNFKVFLSFHAGCQQGGIKYVIDNVKISGVDDVCATCAPSALDDAFVRVNMNELSFNAVLYGSNINYPAAPAGYAADMTGTDNDANDIYAHLRWSAVSQPVNGSVTVNADGTCTITRNAITVSQLTFVYQVCDDGADDNFATTGDNLCDNATVTVIFPTGAPTPVTLINYTGTRNGSTATLKWTTTFESNNTGFEIQRQSAAGVFEKAGWVNSKAPDGNSEVELSYSYSELNTSPALTWYRLVQKDKDGTTKIYAAKAITGQAEVNTVTVFPNPSRTGNITVLFGRNSSRDILVSDVNGRELKRWNNYTDGSLDIKELTNGMYLLVTIDKRTSERTIQKIIVAKQ